MSDQSLNDRKDAKSQRGFEANLRGKLSRGFGFTSSKSSPSKPDTSSGPPTLNVVQHEGVVGEAGTVDSSHHRLTFN